MPNYTKLKASRKKAYLKDHPSPSRSKGVPNSNHLLTSHPDWIKSGRGSKSPDVVLRQDGHPLLHDGYIQVRDNPDPIHKVLLIKTMFISLYLVVQGGTVAYFEEIHNCNSNLNRRSINYGSGTVAKEAIDKIEWR